MLALDVTLSPEIFLHGLPKTKTMLIYIPVRRDGVGWM